MKKFNHFFVLLVVFLLAFVLPIAVVTGKESKDCCEQKTLANCLEQAELRLEQFETEYQAALSSGNYVELDFLSGYIVTEKSNINVIKTLMEKSIEEIHDPKSSIDFLSIKKSCHLTTLLA